VDADSNAQKPSVRLLWPLGAVYDLMDFDLLFVFLLFLVLLGCGWSFSQLGVGVSA
jgi:hypothetical protein